MVQNERKLAASLRLSFSFYTTECELSKRANENEFAFIFAFRRNVVTMRSIATNVLCLLQLHCQRALPQWTINRKHLRSFFFFCCVALHHSTVHITKLFVSNFHLSVVFSLDLCVRAAQSTNKLLESTMLATITTATRKTDALHQKTDGEKN